ncbi:hypothetical protein DVH05_017566 [Phytophthora capsici]|nr:hypothetical protein DVH05_003573 [Phytophthora capsici]KAG1697181.1 hypothetical protein DVH05_017566 [Phytophthora capsici]
MTTGANYNRYRGGDSQHGETKATIAGEIVRFIESCGVTTTRTAKDVQTKILSLEQSFKSAADWLGATGQGVEDETSLRNAVLARCPYYYDLFDVMQDRASTKPLMLNTDTLDSSDESSDDESVMADTLNDSESNTLSSSTASTGQTKLTSA